MSEARNASAPAFRRHVILALFGIVAAMLGWRAVELQLTTSEFLQQHGDARHLRDVSVPVHRSMITDRNGEPLAISTPVHAVWGVPRQLTRFRSRWPELTGVLGITEQYLEALVTPRLDREFLYIKRQVSPDTAAAVAALAIPGVSLVEEYRRYYPTGEVTAHVVGFTNVDDRGQEGLELSYDAQLVGEPGKNRVIKDRLGRVVEEVEQLKAAAPGTPLAISIDKRLQYVAYRELKAAVQTHNAKAGSIVVMDPLTGEVLALVNQPSFNPNNRSALKGQYYRNRAVTDLFEPGSTAKPFTVAAALESGAYQAGTRIDTRPGFFAVGGHTVRDSANHGVITVSDVLTRSSNVGASKIALSLEPQMLWEVYNRLGFGRTAGSGFPGEASSRLHSFHNWREIEQATLSFGYGMSVTALHLTRAYAAIANDGMLPEIVLVKSAVPAPATRAMSVATSRTLRRMLRNVAEHGTGRAARVPGYSVAGKTGTVHKADADGYAEHRYLSLFVGMLPAGRPRLVAFVVLEEPRGGEYYGGKVAAPVFARLMHEATRILNIPPDQPMPGDSAPVLAGAAPDPALALAPEAAQ